MLRSFRNIMIDFTCKVCILWRVPPVLWLPWITACVSFSSACSFSTENGWTLNERDCLTKASTSRSNGAHSRHTFLPTIPDQTKQKASDSTLHQFVRSPAMHSMHYMIFPGSFLWKVSNSFYQLSCLRMRKNREMIGLRWPMRIRTNWSYRRNNIEWLLILPWRIDLTVDKHLRQ